MCGPTTLSVSTGTSILGCGGLSRTKLCPDPLNNIFERLRRTVPPAPAGVEVNHKRQVLNDAIIVLKIMRDRASQLQIELAVSSNKAKAAWL